MLREHRVLGRLQHAVEAAQYNHRQHDEPILRRAVWPAQTVSNLPDFPREFLVTFSKQVIFIAITRRYSSSAARCAALARARRIWTCQAGSHDRPSGKVY